MKTFTVWVLVFYTHGTAYVGHYPTVIDNIASEQACTSLGRAIDEQGRNVLSYICLPVQKVAQGG